MIFPFVCLPQIVLSFPIAFIGVNDIKSLAHLQILPSWCWPISGESTSVWKYASWIGKSVFEQESFIVLGLQLSPGLYCITGCVMGPCLCSDIREKLLGGYSPKEQEWSLERCEMSSSAPSYSGILQSPAYLLSPLLPLLCFMELPLVLAVRETSFSVLY